MGKWRCCECKGDYVLEKSDHVLGVTSVAGAVLASSGARLRPGHYVLQRDYILEKEYSDYVLNLYAVQVTILAQAALAYRLSELYGKVSHSTRLAL